jgi:hypothetical protein
MLRFFITAFAALSTWLVVGLLVSNDVIGFLFGLGVVFVSYYGRKGASNNSNKQASQASQDDYEIDAFEREHGWEGANEQRLALSRNAQTQTQTQTNTTAPDTVAMVEILRRLASLENHVAQLQVALSKPNSVTTQKPVMAQSVSVSTASAALSPSQSYQTAVKPAIHPAALTPTAPAIKNSATSTTSTTPTASTLPPTTIVSPAINRAPVSVAAASYTAPTKAAVPATPSALKKYG